MTQGFCQYIIALESINSVIANWPTKELSWSYYIWIAKLIKWELKLITVITELDTCTAL
jgi:hypothetical protein